CWAEKYGFKCCKNTTEVVFSELEGDYGYENGDWCGKDYCYGKGNLPSDCWAEKYGYRCCKNTTEVVIIQPEGDYGYENGDWCGI
ncbi:Non-catalytic module family DOC2, partial [Piromyces sp. E2]